MKRDTVALSIPFLGISTIAIGLTGLVAPNLLLGVWKIYNGAIFTTFVMISSQVSAAMGLYYFLVAILNLETLFKWSILPGVLDFLVTGGMVAMGIAPSHWLIVAGVGMSGAFVIGAILFLCMVDSNNSNKLTAIGFTAGLVSMLGAMLVFPIWGDLRKRIYLFDHVFCWSCLWTSTIWRLLDGTHNFTRQLTQNQTSYCDIGSSSRCIQAYCRNNGRLSSLCFCANSGFARFVALYPGPVILLPEQK